MKGSPRRFSPIIVLSAALVWWTLLLSITLRIFFDASVTEGWMVVGGFITCVVLGVVLLIKELQEAILVPATRCSFVANSRGFPVPADPGACCLSGLVDQHFDTSRRAVLGLQGPAALSVNRQRSIRQKSRGEQIDLRLAFAKAVIATCPLAA